MKLSKNYIIVLSLVIISSIIFYKLNNIDNLISGCTNPEGLNFNPNATKDDGSCIFNKIKEPEPHRIEKEIIVDIAEEKYKQEGTKKIGESCIENEQCINGNCEKHFKGNYCSLKSGDTFPTFKAVNQHGQIVNIHDFSNEDKYILIELGTVWCAPCNSLASFFAFNENDIKSKKFWKPQYDLIYELVREEKVYFITILYEDEFKDNATYNTAYEWHQTYPDDLITVLADENKYLHSMIKPTGIPAITLLSPDMKIITIATRGFNQAFDKLLTIMD